MLFLFSACDDYLDIRPKGRVIPEVVADYEKMLNYHQLMKTSTEKIAFLDDDVWANTMYKYYDDEEKRAYQWAEYIWHSDVSTPMDWAYERIFVYNTIINNIADADDAGGSETKSIIAEARLGRAWEYFMLVNQYGQHYDKATAATDPGVVLLTKDDITQSIPQRSSVQKIYDFVIDEILTIADELPEINNVFRMTKTSAYAILSRVYLYQGEWEKCVDAASKVLENKSDLFDYNGAYLREGNQFKGIENFPKAEDNPESIFVRYFPTSNGVNAYTYATPEVIDLFDESDLRWTLFFSNNDYFGNSYGEGIFYYYRRLIHANIGMSVSDIILSRAEAYAHMGGQANRDLAMSDLNQLRKKRIKTDLYVDQVAIDDAQGLRLVLDERRRELMYHGLRWFDLKRLYKLNLFNDDIVHEIDGETFTLPAGDNRYVLAFPQNILFFNEHLEENPR